MTLDHLAEQILIELSQMQRAAVALPRDTGEKYDKNGKVVKCVQ